MMASENLIKVGFKGHRWQAHARLISRRCMLTLRVTNKFVTSLAPPAGMTMPVKFAEMMRLVRSMKTGLAMWALIARLMRFLSCSDVVDAKNDEEMSPSSCFW